ncbi:hypothetical protein OTU49_016435, partial [Cherax quadricarinatus]
KCVFCSCCKRDTSRLHTHFTKKHTNSVKNKSPFKTYRSHSEEPRSEETYPLRPRSASENNVSPHVASDGRPKIIIFQSFNGSGGKQEERSSSSATTSSSDRSPVMGNTEVNRAFLEKLEEKIRPDLNCASNSDSEEITMIVNSSELSDDCHHGEQNKSCHTTAHHEEDKEISSINTSGSRNSHAQECGVQALKSSIHHLKLPASRRLDIDGGSDGGEESGMGDLEMPTSDTDSWNLNQAIKRPRCPCMAEKHSEFEWTGITTNSDDLSYSSESEGGWDDNEESDQTFLSSEALDWNIQGSPAAIITSTSNMSVKVSCKIWEGVEAKKVDLSVLDISSAVISKVDSLQHTTHYLQFGLTMATVIALVPSIYRIDYSALGTVLDTVVTNGSLAWIQALQETTGKIFMGLLVVDGWISTVIFLSCVNRFVLAFGFFFLLSVAERTFKQRFLYAKHFCYLTSARRAR